MGEAVARAVFYISDGTGITAETIGRSVLTQFESVDFDVHRVPFVKNPAGAWEAVELIGQAAEATGERAIVVSTMVDPALKAIISESNALVLDVFAPFIAPLERELAVKRVRQVGRAHGLGDLAKYDARMAATNYAMTHDDGVAADDDSAEVVLVGVSRVGKTPTALYMALQYGVRAANYPLVPEDLERGRLPDRLRAVKERLFALTIDPLRLHQVREARRPGSTYASLQQCRWEVQQAERLYKREGLDVAESTSTSVEEMASRVLTQIGHRNGPL